MCKKEAGSSLKRRLLFFLAYRTKLRPISSALFAKARSGKKILGTHSKGGSFDFTRAMLINRKIKQQIVVRSCFLELIPPFHQGNSVSLDNGVIVDIIKLRRVLKTV